MLEGARDWMFGPRVTPQPWEVMETTGEAMGWRRASVALPVEASAPSLARTRPSSSFLAVRYFGWRRCTAGGSLTLALFPVLVLVFLLPPGWTTAVAGESILPRIRVDANQRGFVTAAGSRFVPFGVTYYRPGTGWAPQVWKQFDAEATRADFAKLRENGANCVRVFLTFGSFYPEPGRLDPQAVSKLDRFLTLAAEHGLYVHPTGPDHWEGLPDWARTDRISDERVLAALEDFWRLLAGHFRGRTEIFAYDLLNEPEVPWDTAPLRAHWNRWLETRYPSHPALTNAWKRTDTPAFGAIPPPPKEDAELDPRLLDFQHFREELAVRWTRRQTAAIRAADPEALVTAGLIQWSVPVVLAHVGHYAAFRPEQQAPFLDFLSFHFYPLEHGAYRYTGPDAESRNLAYLDCLARECSRWGKPTVIGEFGWYGGGKPKAFKEGTASTEEDQARWCCKVVEQTRPRVSGWLNWGFQDQPEATDVSEFTGLRRADGTEKAWGREFRRLGASLLEPPPPPRGSTGSFPALDWDRLITSRRAAESFRHAYLEAFRTSASSP